MSKKNLLMMICTGFLSVACEVDYKIDVKQAPSMPVIDAIVTSIADSSYVALSYTSSDIFKGSEEYVPGASVVVVEKQNDNTELSYLFQYHQNKKKYLPPPGFKGTPGRVYTLTLTINAQTYQATDTMGHAPVITSFSYKKYDGANRDRLDKNKYYTVQVIAKRTTTEKRYHLFRFYANGKYVFAIGRGALISDEFLSQEIKSENSDYVLGDRAWVELCSITEPVYRYYASLDNVIDNDSGMFSPPAANPPNNFTNGALGIFRVSDVSVPSKELIIKPL